MRWVLLILVLLNLFAYLWRGVALNWLGQFAGDAAGYHADYDNPIFLLKEFEESGIKRPVVSEPIVRSKPVKKVVGKIISKEKITSSGVSFCWFIGVDEKLMIQPDKDEQLILDQLSRRFAALGIKGNVGIEDSIEGARHVLLVEDVDALDAVRRLEQLLAKGYDAYLVGEGNYAGNIAIGNYALLSDAKKDVENLSGRDIKTRAVTLIETEPRARLVITDKEHASVSAKLWARLKEDWPEIFKEKKYCESVAE